MTKEDPIQCSHCGSNDSVDVRFAACVATSKWDQNNYPAPNTYVTMNDDIRLWRIPLCKKCIPNGYRTFLHNRLSKVAEQFFLCLVLFTVGAVAIHEKIASGAPANFLVTPLHWLLAFAIVIGLIIGIVGVPICTVMLIVNFSRLKSLKQSGVVPAKQIDNSFMGEGQRIINALVPEKGKPLGKVWGEFSLPEFKPLDQALHPRLRQAITVYDDVKNGDRKRDIVAIGKTVDEMEKKLPAEWKSLWKQRK